MDEMKVFDQRSVLGKDFKIYGDIENPLFLAKDVAEWIEHSNHRIMLDSIDENEKVVNNVYTPGGLQEAWFVTEDGLYEILMQSRKPVAKEFKSHVKEILRDIRKHGIYTKEEIMNRMIDDPDFGISLLLKYKEERQARKILEEQNAQKQQIISELQPKATYYDLILQNKSLVSVTVIAKDYGMSGQAMNSLLHELGIQYKMNDTWLLYQEYADKGYTQSKTHLIDADRSKMNTYWTQKGRLFIYETLKREKSILPLIEREKSA